MRTHHDDRHRMAAHDLFQSVDAVHGGHLQVEGHHVGTQLFDLFQAEISVHRGAHDLDGLIGLKHLRDQLAHQGGVVDHQHSNFLVAVVWAHALPPMAVKSKRARSAWFSNTPKPANPVSCGRERAWCSTTAGRFRISTTLPSPRIEAPFTRSVEKVWSSKALMTNSSSPSKASTMRPYRFSPTVMTRTNSFSVRLPGAAEGRPRRSRGRTWLRNCSTS